MQLKTILPWLLLICFAQKAQGVGITASVDRTTIHLGEQITLSLEIQGDRSASAPSLPNLPDFDVMSAGQTSSMQIVNGRINASLLYRYLLIPKNAGIFMIGPARVQVEGRAYQTEPIQVKVLPASAASPEKPEQTQAAFITAKISHPSPFLSEQIVYTFRLYRKTKLYNADLELPAFEQLGLEAEQLGKQQDFQEVLQGERYQVTEIQMALFGQKVGQLSIPPAKLRCEIALEQPKGRRRPFGSMFDDPFDDFFGRVATKPTVLRSNPLTLEVKALPSPPVDFSGLVGQFTLKGNLSKNRLHVGESTTLTLTVRGVGNVKFIPEPKLPDLEAFKVYADKPVDKFDQAGNAVRGVRTFKKALVPQVAGITTLSKARLTYFDPKTESYQVAQTEAFQLEILPPTSEEELKLTELFGPRQGKTAVKLMGQDLLPLHKGMDNLAHQAWGIRSFTLGVLALTVPPFSYGVIFFGRRRKERLSQNVALRRRLQARKIAKKNLKRLLQTEEIKEKQQAVAIASAAMRDYLGDMLDLEGRALTAHESASQLRLTGISEEKIAQVERLLADLESALYGAGADSDPDWLFPKTLATRVEQLIDSLQHDLGKAARNP